MKLTPVVSRLASGSVYLFAVGVAIYALVAPYMSMNLNKKQLDQYLDKECIDNTCAPLSDFYKPTATALYALYVIFVILVGITFILLLANKRMLYNWIGLLLLAIALGTMITLIVITKTTYLTLLSTNYYYDFTSASILMIIACCFIIVKQIFSNDLIRTVVKRIIHK